jgi:cyclopropane-fatty-acyl-phospholipid synthase
MSSTILIAGARDDGQSEVRRMPSTTQKLLRGGILARLRGLRSGAIRLRDALGEQVVGAPGGALGVIDLDVFDPAFWSEVAAGGDVGAGEAFVGGMWRTNDLVGLMQLFVRDRAVLLGVHETFWSLPRRWLLRLGQWLRQNSRAGSKRNIADHYDLGDELFAHFLDPTMTYSSAWFDRPEQSLLEAQQNKLRRLCRLVDLQHGDRLLEIGTGWGSLAMCAAGEFGAQVTTTTISQNQHDRARQRIADAGLAPRIDVLRQDYRDLQGTYDKLLSCEMIEAVGARFLPTYLKVCAQRLRPGGVLGLQAITIAHQHYAEALRMVDYIRRHVFPGSFIPSIQAIADAAARHTDLRFEACEDFGLHYATTLQRWRQTVMGSPGPFLQRGGEALVRAWEYYFAYCEAGFRERHIGVAHLRFRRAGS